MRRTCLLLVLVALLALASIASAQQAAVRWEVVPWAGIPGHNVRILKDVSLEEAKRACVEGGFKSFDYERKARRAFLQDVDMDDTPLKTDYEDDPYDHYTLRRPAVPSPPSTPPAYDRVQAFDQTFERVEPESSAAERAPFGSVKAVVGEVWYGRSRADLEANRQRLGVGDGVVLSSFIETGPGGRVVVELDRGAITVSLGGDTLLDLKGYVRNVAEARSEHRRHPLLNVVKGYVRAVTGALFGRGDRLFLQAQNGTCGVRGTDVVFGHDETTGSDLVPVRMGEVEVSGHTAGRVLVGAGAQVRLADGEVGAVTRLDATLWRRYAPGS